MQSIKKNRSSKKKILLTLLVGVVLIAIGYGAYAAIAKIGPFSEPDDSTVDYNQPTDDQKDTGEDISNEAKDPEPVQPEKPSDDPQTPAPDPKQVTVTITAAAQSGATLQVRTTIASLESGTCALTLARSGQPPVTKTAATQALTSFSTCQGFNIPVGDLAKGEWQLTIDYKAGEHTGSATKTVTIQ